MHILRYTRDVYDQPAIQGMSWDLLGLFFFGALAIVAVHAIYMMVAGRSKSGG